MPRPEGDISLVADDDSATRLMPRRALARYRRRVDRRFLARVLDLGLLGTLVGWSQLDVWAPQITTPNHMVGDRWVLSAASLAAGAAGEIDRQKKDGGHAVHHRFDQSLHL